MKHFIYTFIATLFLGVAFVSCDKGNSTDEIIKHEQTPEITAAGEYTGTWIRQNSTDTLSAEGSIQITATDTPYVARVRYICPDFSLDKSCNANIAYSGNGYVYFNNASTNELGSIFAGRIGEDSRNSVSFVLSLREGRKLVSFTLNFSGTK